MTRLTAATRRSAWLIGCVKLSAVASAVLIIAVLATSEIATSNSSKPLVGHIMALLSVFEQAHALPPEASPEAQILVRALIQTQAALRKTTHQATRLWFSEALQKGEQAQGEPLPPDALTSRTLEAILRYAASRPPTRAPGVMAGLTEFNVGSSELELMAKVYWRAKNNLSAIGQDLHALYKKERRLMPSPG